ncbi:hypothetical protein [Meiothermus sp.]|uniref:hypothetical protein n=1 Tax=Meiothermus sp. TaxID=1955249 RepID=UPI00307FC5BA
MIDLRGFRGWAELTNQPFLRLLRQGQVSSRAFTRWLVQEQYLYEAMLGLQTSLLRRAPQLHRLIKANALLVTVEELDWLAHLDLPKAPVHPSRQGYLDFLRALEQAPYAVGTVAHWARHRAFFDAWSSLRSRDPEEDLGGLADEITQHWMAPEAQALIHDFGSLALEVSEQLSPTEVNQIVGRVFELEQSAWEMALEFALDDKSGEERGS